jgi:hypothetical protein
MQLRLSLNPEFEPAASRGSLICREKENLIPGFLLEAQASPLGRFFLFLGSILFHKPQRQEPFFKHSCEPCDAANILLKES